MSNARGAKERGIYLLRFEGVDGFYIGSAMHMKQRWNKHMRLLRKRQHANPMLQAAWDKAGEGAAQVFVLEDVGEAAMLAEREQHYIDTMNPPMNILLKAKSWLGMHHSQESREKIGRAHRGKKMPRESVERMREKLRGNRNAAGGRGKKRGPASAQARRNMSEGQRRSIEKKPKEAIAAAVERMVGHLRGKPKPKEWREAMGQEAG